LFSKFRKAFTQIMSDKAVEIAGLLAPTVQALGLELLGVEFSASGGNALLRLYIEAPGRHVAIEDCEAVSREISAVLDVNDPISSQYTLEVSSPGIDRPLFTLAHFERFVGEQVKLALRLPQEGRRRLQGRIAAIQGRSVAIAEDGKAEPFVVAHENIEKARLVPDLAALGLAPVKPGHKSKNSTKSEGAKAPARSK
jgi:ribosome maturation factor RimP